METPVLIYRLSAWSQDIILIYITWHLYQRLGLGNKNYQNLFWYFICISILEILAAGLVFIFEDLSIFVNIYIGIEFALLCNYLIQFNNNTIIKRVVYLIVGLFSFYIIAICSNRNLWQLHYSFNVIFTSIISAILAILAIKPIFEKNTTFSLLQIPEAWIFCAFLLINLFTIIFLFVNNYAFEYQSKLWFYIINISSNVLKSIFLIFVIIGIRKTPISNI